MKIYQIGSGTSSPQSTKTTKNMTKIKTSIANTKDKTRTINYWPRLMLSLINLLSLDQCYLSDYICNCSYHNFDLYGTCLMILTYKNSFERWTDRKLFKTPPVSRELFFFPFHHFSAPFFAPINFSSIKKFWGRSVHEQMGIFINSNFPNIVEANKQIQVHIYL